MGLDIYKHVCNTKYEHKCWRYHVFKFHRIWQLNEREYGIFIKQF